MDFAATVLTPADDAIGRLADFADQITQPDALPDRPVISIDGGGNGRPLDPGRAPRHGNQRALAVYQRLQPLIPAQATPLPTGLTYMITTRGDKASPYEQPPGQRPPTAVEQQHNRRRVHIAATTDTHLRHLAGEPPAFDVPTTHQSSTAINPETPTWLTFEQHSKVVSIPERLRVFDLAQAIAAQARQAGPGAELEIWIEGGASRYRRHPHEAWDTGLRRAAAVWQTLKNDIDTALAGQPGPAARVTYRLYSRGPDPSRAPRPAQAGQPHRRGVAIWTTPIQAPATPPDNTTNPPAVEPTPRQTRHCPHARRLPRRTRPPTRPRPRLRVQPRLRPQPPTEPGPATNPGRRRPMWTVCPRHHLVMR